MASSDITFISISMRNRQTVLDMKHAARDTRTDTTLCTSCKESIKTKTKTLILDRLLVYNFHAQSYKHRPVRCNV
jgi:hypothetical protein